VFPTILVREGSLSSLPKITPWECREEVLSACCLLISHRGDDNPPIGVEILVGLSLETT
jgi:hypothetical protein